MEVIQNLPVIGKKYRVDHSHKGRFDLQVTEVNGEWTIGLLLSRLVHTTSGSPRIGDSMAVRTQHATFTPIKE